MGKLEFNVSETHSIRIRDFRNYVSGKGNNGGCYGFYTYYDRLEDDADMFVKWYDTTADMSYCPVCGTFNDHHYYDDDGNECYECGEFTIISKEDLIKILEKIVDEIEDEGDYDRFRIDYWI